MATSTKQDKAFNAMIGDELPGSFLQSCIDWIRDNLNPDEVFEPAALTKFMGETKMPNEVFDDAELKRWAIEHGFVAPPPTETELFVNRVLNG